MMKKSKNVLVLWFMSLKVIGHRRLWPLALELQFMDRARSENDRVIRGFCEELGIEMPF